MFNTILVALDGTPAAAAALPLAATLARGRAAELVLVQVSADYHERSPAYVAARDHLAACAAGLAAHGLRAATDVRYGIAAEQIVAAAQQHRADMVLLATHGRHGLARAWCGSVTEGVVATSPVPVLLLRAGETIPRQVQTLLVPLDETPGSAAALAVARALALMPGATLILLRVVAPLPRWDEGQDGALDRETALRREAGTALDRVVRDLLRHGIVARSRIAIGPVAETIAATAGEVGADLIVMGTRGRTGPRRAVLGSVADAVVRGADRPVLLVRPDDTPDPPVVSGPGVDARDEARPDVIPIGR